MAKNAIVLFPVKRPETRTRLQSLLPELTFCYLDDAPITVEQFENAAVIFGNPSGEQLSHCKSLEWLQLGSAGADYYVKEGILPAGAKLTNATGAYGPAIAEYMLAVTLAMFNKLPLYRDNQFAGIWENLGPARTLSGSVVLSVGMGDIGGEFAKRMKALGCTVYGIRRTKAAAPDYVDGLYQMDALDALLPKADIVALSLPNSPQTTGLITKERLARMKKDALLINIGRGSAIDTEALCDALEAGTIGGAALDVTDPEPLPSDHRLWTCKNALITPHISGGFGLFETYDRFIAICEENIARYHAGEELKNSVDFSTGYRKSN